MSLTKVRESMGDFNLALKKLNGNSKLQIKILTILAENNVKHASQIVRAIEEHLQNLKNKMLPVLYLIDSIVKNVKGVYLQLFSEKIVDIFCYVFEKADVQTRVRMWKLRETWNGIFPVVKLYSLDLEVHMLDQAWPISIPLSTRGSNGSSTSPISKSENPKTKALIDCQKKILQLEKQKAELEELQAHLELQQSELKKLPIQTSAAPSAEVTEKRLVHSRPSNQVDEQLVTRNLTHSSFQQLARKRPSDEPLKTVALKKIKMNRTLANEADDLQPMTNLSSVSPVIPPQGHTSISDSNEYRLDMNSNLELRQNSQEMSSNSSMISGPWSSNSSMISEPMESSSPPPCLPGNLNITELLQKLVDTGIVPNPTASRIKTIDSQKQVETKFDLALITFARPETLKRPANFSSLYGGRFQCSSCGFRFSAAEATKYREHLDWHFRQNRKRKEKKLISTPWYLSINDWAQYDTSPDQKPSWFEQQKQDSIAKAAMVENSPPPSVPSNSGDTKCSLCHDKFEEFYNEEEEEWQLKPAVSYETHNYHPFCLTEYKRTL